MAESKETEGGRNDTGKPSVVLNTSTPCSLFGPYEPQYIAVSPDDKLLVGLIDYWCCVGVNHVIDPQKTASFEVMATQYRRADKRITFTLGFASEGVINTTVHQHPGRYLEGWDIHSTGRINCDHQGVGSQAPIALHQPLKLELSKYTLNIYIKGIKTSTHNLRPFFDKHKDAKFYFCVCMAGKDMKIKIIDFKAEQ